VVLFFISFINFTLAAARTDTVLAAQKECATAESEQIVLCTFLPLNAINITRRCVCESERARQRAAKHLLPNTIATTTHSSFLAARQPVFPQRHAGDDLKRCALGEMKRKNHNSRSTTSFADNFSQIHLPPLRLLQRKQIQCKNQTAR
jgi:hypothetical protein